jgi:hypothetical protein
MSRPGASDQMKSHGKIPYRGLVPVTDWERLGWDWPAERHAMCHCGLAKLA